MRRANIFIWSCLIIFAGCEADDQDGLGAGCAHLDFGRVELPSMPTSNMTGKLCWTEGGELQSYPDDGVATPVEDWAVMVLVPLAGGDFFAFPVAGQVAAADLFQVRNCRMTIDDVGQTACELTFDPDAGTAFGSVRGIELVGEAEWLR